MSKNILTMALLLATASLTFAQLKVVAPHDNVGIGIANPETKLHLQGKLRIVPNSNDNDAYLEIGKNRSIDGKSIIDLYPSTTSESWIARFQSLINANGKEVSTFSHNGDGVFLIKTLNPASDIFFQTSTYKPNGTVGSFSRLTIKPNGNVGVGINSPAAKLHVNGVAVKPNGGMWSDPSDLALKTNVVNYNKGLASILQLNPVYYKYNGESGIEDTKTLYVGLIAQEYQKIAPDAVQKYKYTEVTEIDDELSYKTGSTKEFLSSDPTQIIYMLVNAVKEQNAKIEDFEKRFEKLSVTSNALNHVHHSTVIIENNQQKALLSQNAPNPFTNNTKIEYFIPINAKTAMMSFVDINGKEIKRIKIDHTGFGTLNVELKDLSSGIYAYTLIVDNKTVDTKEMVLNK